uniref:hypothetical protein n=1 Tax=Actinokineospora sp. CA-119265 TaxID=3239890 RepID=UPI003F49644F
MTKGLGEGNPAAGDDGERVRERVVRRECANCGTTIFPNRTGRPPVYCSDSCRSSAWALRRAERRLRDGRDSRPAVIREVVERPPRHTTTTAPTLPATAPPTPRTAAQWTVMLHALTAQLADETSPMAREHWRHRHLYAALLDAFDALGRAHPGGLDRLNGRR